MVGEQATPETENLDQVMEIMDRAFDSAFPMPKATAELILQTKLPEADVQRVDELLARKSEGTLPFADDLLLKSYLKADTLLTLLKSKARQSLGRSISA